MSLDPVPSTHCRQHHLVPTQIRRLWYVTAQSREGRGINMLTLLQILRDAELTVTNFHDLLSLLCPDFQLRVVKSAFKAAWVVLRGELPALSRSHVAVSCCSTFRSARWIAFMTLA